jgi:tRNA pseudouridine38-40 synthase
LARYKVILAYDGTEFAGFQRQKNTPTIQSEVENVLRMIGWKGTSILAAGRTDTGVHAEGQVISFDMDWAHSVADLRNAMNANFPKEIAARSVVETSVDFHPRYDAIARRYTFRVVQEAVPNPLEERYAWRVWPAVKLGRVQRAATFLIGEHDFSAFGSPYKAGGSTIRRVFDLVCKSNGRQIQFSLTANAFLYHMVRRVVYALVQIGQEYQNEGQIKRMLEACEPDTIQGIAPSAGLFLSQVYYLNEELYAKSETEELSDQ